VNEIERARISMMARSLKAPSIGRIQKRKTNLLQIIIFGLQRAAGPYRRANNGREQSQQNGCYSITSWASASNVGGNREAKRPGCFEVDHKLAVLRRQQRADTGECVRRVTHSLLSLPRLDGFKICNYFEGSLGGETSPGPSKKR
jgi:hypothetical protein